MQPAPLLFQQVASDPENAAFRAQGWPPVYTASQQSRIVPVSLGMMPADGCYASGWG